MDNIIRDLEWFYEILKKGGKTAEYYESQAILIADAIKKLKEQNK